MIELVRRVLVEGRVHRFVARDGGRPVSRREVVTRLADDAALRTAWIELVAAEPFVALRLETPALTTESAGEPFELVTVDDPSLAVPASPRAFDEHFAREPGDVLVFPNLGGDALLVVPRPLDDATDHAHLAAFTRTAPLEQQHALWSTVGAVTTERIGERPLWLSTAGGGVPWLHVRLDDRPKYYAWIPYRHVGYEGDPP